MPPARRGWRRAARFASGRAWSASAAQKDAVAVNAAHLTAIMVKPFERREGPGGSFCPTSGSMRWSSGPAWASASRPAHWWKRCWRAGPALVLDADALTAFRDDPKSLFTRIKHATVLTPHAGEFERLFPGLLTQRRQQGRGRPHRRRARQGGGSAEGRRHGDRRPDGRAAINANAPPTLATAGAGDVLAGFIGGLLAQGMPAFEAAARGGLAAWRCRRAFRARPDRRGSAGNPAGKPRRAPGTAGNPPQHLI